MPLPSRTAITLARSRTLPPPIATTASAPAARAVAIAARASSTVGSCGDRDDGDRLDLAEQVPVAGRVAAGEEHHLAPQGRQQVRELVRAARAEQHPPRQGEVERAHQPSSSGKSAVKRVDARGCAIMSATASRQRA